MWVQRDIQVLPCNHHCNGKATRITCVLYILLTVHPNMIVFFYQLIHKFFILIHLLYSLTCVEHYYAHLQEDKCISAVSGIVTLFR